MAMDVMDTVGATRFCLFILTYVDHRASCRLPRAAPHLRQCGSSPLAPARSVETGDER